MKSKNINYRRTMRPILVKHASNGSIPLYSISHELCERQTAEMGYYWSIVPQMRPEQRNISICLKDGAV